jgi:hypothetical protein
MNWSHSVLVITLCNAKPGKHLSKNCTVDVIKHTLSNQLMLDKQTTYPKPTTTRLISELSSWHAHQGSYANVQLHRKVLTSGYWEQVHILQLPCAHFFSNGILVCEGCCDRLWFSLRVGWAELNLYLAISMCCANISPMPRTAASLHETAYHRTIILPPAVTTRVIRGLVFNKPT